MKIKFFFSIFIRTLNLLWHISPRHLLGISILSCLSGLMTPLGLLIWQNIVNIITKLLQFSLDVRSLYYWLFFNMLFYLLIMVIGNVILFIIQYIQRIYSGLIEKYIVLKLFEKLSSFSLEMYDDSDLYNEIQKADAETASRSLSMIQTLIKSIQYISTFLGTISILSILSPLLVVVSIITSFPIFVSSFKILNKLFYVYNSRCEKLRFSQEIKEILINYNNIKEVKMLNCSKFLLSKLNDIYKQNTTEDKYIYKKLTKCNSFIAILDNLFNVFLKLVTIILSIKNLLEIGTILMYVSSIDTLKETTKNILSQLSSTYEDCLYLQSFFYIMDYKVIEQDKDIFNGKITSVEFQDVTFHYPNNDKPTLKNISFTLNCNKSYAIIGLNGSGKTTLIKLLCNLYHPISGQILINGVDINKYENKSIVSHISTLFQDYIRYPLTIRENIAIGNISHINDDNFIHKCSKFSNMYKYICSLPQKLDTKVSKGWSNGTELSGGQWQQLAISRTLMKGGDVLIFDELDSSLDINIQHRLFDQLDELKNGHICIFTTHKIENLKAADEIIVLNGGELESIGNHNELIKKSKIYQNILNMNKE